MSDSGALESREAQLRAEHPEIPHPQQLVEPQLVEILVDMGASTELIPEPSPSSEPRIAISISEYRGLCHTLQALTTSQSILTQEMIALRAHQEQIIATQTQHTAILRQIQHHLDIPSAPERPTPILSKPIEPSQAPHFVEQALHSEEPTTGDAETST
ncbi:hypothetical protein CK203_108795 [Vitis vinifera]|uniref:Uncharacterized protein n=1 Tax=Vitis vinifera TaxID=29760 RepID=A0A438BP87_VITVI|nr:hypothetical protein CK203_108795 [Vitis vinifera]